MVLKPRLSSDGMNTPTENGWRLTIPAGPEGRYRLSQLDDYTGLSREAYPWRPPLTISLRARLSSPMTPGTWGFGLWNDPFGFSFGAGDTFFRLPILPNAIWFFYASSKNFLSFRNDRPAQGFLTQVFQSPRFHTRLLIAGLSFPFSRRTSRRLLSQVIQEDSLRLYLDVTEWQSYRLEWDLSMSSFWVNDALVFRSTVSPEPPLGIVIWIDNLYAAFTPDGKLDWGREKNLQNEWLDIEDVVIRNR
jgi:hypothetical protein